MPSPFPFRRDMTSPPFSLLFPRSVCAVHPLVGEEQLSLSCSSAAVPRRLWWYRTARQLIIVFLFNDMDQKSMFELEKRGSGWRCEQSLPVHLAEILSFDDTDCNPRWDGLILVPCGDGPSCFPASTMPLALAGRLNITTTNESTKWRGYNPYKRKYETLEKYYRSSMLNTWNKFCFTGECRLRSS